MRPFLNKKQLPPVLSSDDNHVLDNPHIFLDEIMRQAQDSEIMRLSMHIREGRPLSTYIGEQEQVKILNKKDLNLSVCNWADQILCATNEARNALNNVVRKGKGYSLMPVPGDKIISLSNHWDFFTAEGTWPLTNGAIGTLSSFKLENKYPPRYIHEGKIEIMYSNISFENENFINVPIDFKCLMTGDPALTPVEQYKIGKTGKYKFTIPYDFAFGYAITTWKAQGSSWPKVLLVEEKFPFEKELHKNFLYTAITRAEDKVVIVKKD